MATVEALDELYAMGFILEHEYHQRRAALGAPIAAKDTNTGNTDPQPPETPYNPYDIPTTHHEHTGFPHQTGYEPTTGQENGFTGNQDYGRTEIPIYNPPEPIYEPPQLPIDPYNTEPTYGIGEVRIDPYVSPIPPDFGIHPTNTHILPSHEPVSASGHGAVVEEAPARAAVNPEAPYPAVKVDSGLEKFPNLSIPRAADSGHVEDFSHGLAGRAGIVWRGTGSYELHQVDAPNSAYSVLKQLGVSNDDYELLEAGQWTTKTTKEMYWSDTTHVPPAAANEVQPNKVYLIHPQKSAYCRKYMSGPIDERIIWKYMRGMLEATPCSSMNYDEFEGDPHIRDIRTFTVDLRPTSFDPREAIRYFATKLTKFEVAVSSNTTRPAPKLKTIPTPPRMLWPLLIGQLRAMQARVSEAQTRMLPKSSAEIWARIERSYQTGECYFTGQRTYNDSFLCERLHNDNICELVAKIKENNLVPAQKSKKVEPPPAVHREVRSIWSVNDTEERISYDSSAKKRSYGWPSAADVSGEPLKPFALLSRPVSVVRGPDILPILNELIQRAGPAATLPD